jgi:hypothetical protein
MFECVFNRNSGFYDENCGTEEQMSRKTDFIVYFYKV